MDEAEGPATISALINQREQDRGSHPAIITNSDSLTYGELAERSARLARAFIGVGAGKGTRIALLAPDGIDWVVTYLAALRIGALLTTVSTLSTAQELAHIIRNSDCQHLIAARRFLGHDFASKLEQALPRLSQAPAGELRLADAPHLRAIWLDDAREIGWAKSWTDLNDTTDLPDAALLSAVEADVSPADDAVVVYTSGSTARPKAVVHRHWALVRHSRVLADQFALTPDDRMMPLLPAFWLAGMSMMMQVLTIGATLVYPDVPENDHILDLIGRLGVTRVNAWGDRQVQLVRAASERGLCLDHIPDLVPARDAQGRPLPLVPPSYGMTESCSAHSAWPMNVAVPDGKEGSFGIAIDGYERRVVDPESGRERAVGEVGELQIRGPALMSGFYGLPGSEVFTPDGFYPTKDLVRIDADGFLYPAGRISDMIKTRGANVSRLEVEAALNAHLSVHTSVVAGLPDEELGEMVVAAVVLSDGSETDEGSLREALRDRLSSFKVPRRIVFIQEEEIPRTATGKVKLSEVADMIAKRIG
ncbi:MAG: acyl--CoA ligase [Novosphingobium sp.]|nr:acyl--CoA ligase [Novosphingobium sp.]